MELKQEILDKMIERLVSLIGEKDYNEATDFEGLNLKSVNYAQITTVLEDEFDVEIPYMDFKRKATLGEAADYVMSLIEE